MRREKKGKLLEEAQQRKKGGSLTRTVTETGCKERENEKEPED